MHVLEVIRRPLVTEKNSLLQERNKYAFEVARVATKHQIKEAVEHAFNVKVLAVNVVNVRGKERRWGRKIGWTEAWKKAIVTLSPGQTIQFFEGV